jgi:hypothetical protein
MTRSVKPVSIVRLVSAGSLAATLLSVAMTAVAADAPGVKDSARTAGQTVGSTAKEVGHEAKSAAPGIWQSMKNIGKSIATGAKKAGSEVKPAAKNVGGEIKDGAKNVGSAAKESGGKVKDSVAGDKKKG